MRVTMSVTILPGIVLLLSDCKEAKILLMCESKLEGDSLVEKVHHRVHLQAGQSGITIQVKWVEAEEETPSLHPHSLKWTTCHNWTCHRWSHHGQHYTSAWSQTKYILTGAMDLLPSSYSAGTWDPNCALAEYGTPTGLVQTQAKPGLSLLFDLGVWVGYKWRFFSSSGGLCDLNLWTPDPQSSVFTTRPHGHHMLFHIHSRYLNIDTNSDDETL